MTSYALDWLNLLVRWFHFVAGISWIGASFYFVWLDNHLLPPKDARDATDGVSGELWSVHGGGFYHNLKYPTGPKSQPLTEALHWFKWEAYSTWLSGMAMLAIVYWASAGTMMIDKRVLNLTPAEAIVISIASIGIGLWIYDVLCKIFENRPLALGVAVYVFLVLATWGLFHVFGARAAYIQIGAIAGTIMVANVAHFIIPGQRKMLAQIRAGEVPDPKLGSIGKTRSVHNTYFTLPVLFTMIGNHYPMTYDSPFGWEALAVLSLASILVRQFFLLTHKQRYVPALLAGAAVLISVVAIALAPRVPATATNAANVSFAEVQPIFAQRCAVCHAERPSQPGFSAPPEGVLLDSPEHIKANAARAYAQAVLTQNMPIGNVTQMTTQERAEIGAWVNAGAKEP
ncbi:MAG: urate hydroxylase PuuD [Candidatus Eremiobacteraeota bacterium]|nr:urate hydroxylase PuuD [Candidatus Eremiobacteraeota bacterium]